MRREIVFCDKCGNEAKEARVLIGFDMCKECYSKAEIMIVNWMTPEGMPKIVEPVAVKEYEEPKAVVAPAQTTMQGKTKPFKIDWDKACALKVAGWSNKQIADELKCNFETINAMIYARVKQYKEGFRYGKREDENSDELN